MRILFLPLCLFYCFNVKAQSNTDTSLFQKPSGPVSAITFSPLALIQLHDFTLMAGAEKWIYRRANLTLDAGWIFASNYFGTDESFGACGFIIRPGIKYFITPTRRGYLQGQFFYKQVTHHIYDWLQKELLNGVPSYEQLQEFKFRRKVHGYHLILGLMLPLKKDRKLFLDWYLGLGVRYKWSSIPREKNSRYPAARQFFVDNEDEGSTLPSLPFGFRLFFRLP